MKHRKIISIDELVVGDIYRIKCGWGWTNAKLIGKGSMTDGKPRFEWQDMKNKIFTFCSYDLEDTYKKVLDKP